jgi:hypothetical protein
VKAKKRTINDLVLLKCYLPILIPYPFHFPLLDAESDLELNKLKILIGKPKSIQNNGRIPPPPHRTGSNVSINSRGSVRSRGSQTSIRRQPTPKKSLARRFLTSTYGFFKNVVRPEPPLESSSSDSSVGFTQTKFQRKHDKWERDPEWLYDPPPESSQDDMQAAYERRQRARPP